MWEGGFDSKTYTEFSRFISRFPLPKESLTGACFCELTNISKTCLRETGNVNIIEKALWLTSVLQCGLSDNSLSSNVGTFQHATFMPTELENQFVCLSFLDNADLLSLILLPLNEQSASRGYWPDSETKHLFGIPFLISARIKQCSPRKAAWRPLTPPNHAFRLD